MKTKILMMSLILLLCGYATVSFASDTLGTVKWKMANMKDAEGNAISPALEYISVAVDMGGTYFNAYGALLNDDGTQHAPASGAGYVVDYSDRGSDVFMELRANIFFYKLIFDISSLNGSVVVYRADGAPIASGDLQFLSFTPPS